MTNNKHVLKGWLTWIFGIGFVS